MSLLSFSVEDLINTNTPNSKIISSKNCDKIAKAIYDEGFPGNAEIELLLPDNSKGKMTLTLDNKRFEDGDLPKSWPHTLVFSYLISFDRMTEKKIKNNSEEDELYDALNGLDEISIFATLKQSITHVWGSL